MARRGRPRKNLTPIDKEKMQLTDDIVNQLKYNSELSDEQIFLLKKTLDDTFKSYDLEKQVDSLRKLNLNLKPKYIITVMNCLNYLP